MKKSLFKFLTMKERLYRADFFCDIEQEDYVQLECGSELGGVIALGFIAPSAELGANEAAIIANLEDEDFWVDTLIGGSPQLGFVLKGTRGSLPAGTPTEEDGYGLVPTQRTGDDRELSFEVQGVMENRNFIAALNKKTDWGMVYVTAGKDGAGYEAFYVSNVSVYASDLIEQSIKTRKRWSGSAKWSTDMTPGLPFIAPASVFTA